MQEKSLQICVGYLLYIVKTCAQDTILQGWAKNDWGAVAEWLPELRMG